MSEDPLLDALDALRPASVAARLRWLMPHIDRRVSEGISHEAIVAALKAEGLEVSLNTFRSNLYRYRRTRRTSPQGGAGEPVQRAITPAAAAADPPPSEGQSAIAPQSTAAEVADLRPSASPREEPAGQGPKLKPRTFAETLDPVARAARADKLERDSRPFLDLTRPKT